MKVGNEWVMYVVGRARSERGDVEYWAGVQRWVVAPRVAYLFESKIAADLRARKEVGASVFQVTLKVNVRG